MGNMCQLKISGQSLQVGTSQRDFLRYSRGELNILGEENLRQNSLTYSGKYSGVT